MEFARGSFPGAVNLPLLTDTERERVGTVYKREGHDAAVALGHRLVSGEVKERRVAGWVDFLRAHPDALIFCWRGGQRSAIAQRWIHEASGLAVPRLEGGYKAFRNWLLEESRSLFETADLLILGGRTGSGKTLILKDMKNAVDLEGLANHRGSAFGRYASAQPPQIGFENAMAYAMIGLAAKGYGTLLFEDESRSIGRVHIPHPHFPLFQERGRLVLLERPLEERVAIAYDDYILFGQRDYDEAYARGENPYPWIEAMRHNFGRIRKRLGGECHAKLTAMLEEAWRRQCETGDPSGHKAWIAALLREYYDPMYDWQIENKKEKIVFRGDEKAVRDFLKEHER